VVGRGALGEPRARAVESEQLGLALRRLRGALLQHPHGAGVQLAAALAQQGGVGGVLHQRVLERVDRLGRLAAAPHEVGCAERVECGAQRWLRRTRYPGDEIVGELAAENRARLRHLARRGEPVEAGHQRGLQAARHGELRKGPIQRPVVAVLAQQAGLQHRAGDLLDEQRHAVGARQHLRLHLRRERLAPRDTPQQRGVLGPAEAV
jgi:hypothetical protein